MYESYGEPLLSRRAFLGRLLRHLGVALVLLVLPLAIGMAGYVGLAGLTPVDAFLNAAMILGGMGPVDRLESDGAKIFAGAYAILSGIVIIGAAGIVLAPVLHRILHALHLDDSDDEARPTR